MKESMYGKTQGLYCERGMDAGFWAEPLNAISNVAFILASVALFMPSRKDGRYMSYALTAMIFIIGIGSFLFHTFATRWSSTADVAPIFIFMLMAIGVMGSRGLSFKHWAIGGTVSLTTFFALIYLVTTLSDILTKLIGSSIGYLPAWSMLFIGGIGLLRSQPKAGKLLLTAGIVFTVSMTARVIDSPYCEMWRIQSQQIGTHFVWHILNSLTLYLVCVGLMALPRR